MRQLEVSIGIIEQDDAYLLQRRSSDVAKGASGLIGAFGGQLEPNETPLEAVCRELSEETSLSPSTEDFKYLGSVKVVSDRDHSPVEVMAHAFRIIITPSVRIRANEGEIVQLTRKEVNENIEKITPATRATFEQLIQGD